VRLVEPSRERGDRVRTAATVRYPGPASRAAEGRASALASSRRRPRVVPVSRAPNLQRVLHAGTGPLSNAHRLDEGVPEDAVRLGRPAKLLDPLLPVARLHEAQRKDSVASSLDHRDEGLLDEPFHPLRSAPVRADHARRRRDRREPSGGEEGKEPAPDQRIAAGSRLHLDEALDRPSRRGAIRIEERRPVIALDDGDASAGPEARPEARQSPARIRQMFEHEADEDVIEALCGKGQVEDVGPLKRGIANSSLARAGFCARQRFRREIDACELRLGAVPGEGHGLRSHPATGLQHRGAGRIPRAPVEQLGERARLGDEPSRFAAGVTMNILASRHSAILRPGPASRLGRPCGLKNVQEPTARSR